MRSDACVANIGIRYPYWRILTWLWEEEGIFPHGDFFFPIFLWTKAARNGKVEVFMYDCVVSQASNSREIHWKTSVIQCKYIICKNQRGIFLLGNKTTDTRWPFATFHWNYFTRYYKGKRFIDLLIRRFFFSCPTLTSTRFQGSLVQLKRTCTLWPLSHWGPARSKALLILAALLCRFSAAAGSF